MKFLGKATVKDDGINLPEKVLDFLLATDGDDIYFYEADGKLVITRFPVDEAVDIHVDNKPPAARGPFDPQADDMIPSVFRGMLGGNPDNLEDVTKAMEQFLGPLIGNISEMIKQFQGVLTSDESSQMAKQDDEPRNEEPANETKEDDKHSSDEEKRVKIDILDDDDDSSAEAS